MKIIKILTIVAIVGACGVVYGQETAETPTEVAFPHGSISGVI